ncbi:hypothetical protein RB195_022043 [Necator americanus]|uniref:CCHC-type domain-containing protein n=1 Tax=Necator americanus TaxID=51031 RepID=A0ABR1EGG8_NECAM
MMLFVSHAKGGTTGELWTRSGQMEALLAPARPFRRSTGVKGGATWHEGRSSTAAGLIRANAWSTRGAPKPLDTCRPWTDQGGMGRRHQGPLRQPEPHEDARDGAIPRSSVRDDVGVDAVAAVNVDYVDVELVPIVMGPPVTRSRTLSSGSRAVAPISSLESRAVAPIHRSVSLTSTTGRLVRTLQELNDGDNAYGKDAKTLPWQLRKYGTAPGESASAVGNRIATIPMVATYSPNGPTPRLVPFTGSGDDATPFSLWLRCLEDGVARERVEELSQQERYDFNAIVAHLKQAFEGPQHRYMVRQALSACQQQTGESSATFANRLLNLVRAATTGQDHSSQKERVLEEFVARLRPDIRYYVKLDNPLTFEQAVAKAQMVEQLLAEATADRLINPVGAARMIEVKAVAAKPPRTNFGERRYVRRSLSRTNRPRFFQQSARNQDVSRQHGIPDCRLVPSRSNCFNCGGLGHHARQCQSPAVQLPASGRRQSSLRGALPFYDRQRFSSSSVNAVYPDSDALSQELSQAREQFNALSISLRNSQAACEHSEARVSALIKRNEELASSAFGQLSQSSLRSPHNLPDVRLLFACSLILTLCTSTNAACVNSPFSVSDAFNASNLVTIGRSLGYCQ